MKELKLKSNKLKNIVGSSSMSKPDNKRTGVYKWSDEEITIPPNVRNWLDDHHEEVFANLTRGLKVAKPLIAKAKRSLHLARKIVIKKMLAYSYTDSEICMELELNGNQLQQYKRSLFKEEIEALRKSTPEEQFVQYRHNQMEVIKDIDMLILKFRETKHLSALSNALRTKSEILKDISSKAQEMGFMEKRASEVKIINDIDLSQLKPDELFSLIQRQQNLVKKVAKGQITSLTEIKNSLKLVPSEEDAS